MTQKLNDEQGHEWEAEQAQTEAVPIMNEGTGRPIILRTFEFNLPPGSERPKKQDIIDAHKQRIQTYLWKDELVLIQDLKVVFAQDSNSFRIFATCQGKPGSVIMDTPNLIQDVIRPK